jgi:cytochrome c-type biogenesis protein CcmH/NrfG
MPFKFFIIAGLTLLLFATSCKRGGEDQKDAVDSLSSGQVVDPQVKALTEKIEKDPNNPENYFIRSNVFLQLNNVPSAFADASRAIALDSTNLSYYFGIADIFLKGGAADNAIDAFNQILRLDPGNKEALLKLSKVYYYKKDYPKFIETTCQSAGDRPGQPGNLFCERIEF